MNDNDAREDRADAAREVRSIAVVLVAGALQLLVGYFTVAAIGLFSVPPWAIAVLAGAWIVTTALIARTVRDRPYAALALPVANVLFLWGLLTVGDIWFGWTA